MSDLLRHRGARRFSLEGRLARQHFVDDAGQAVDVAGNANVLLPGCLLRTHVLRGPQRQTVERQRLALVRGVDVGDAEIRKQRMVVREENVLRLHVAVHETVAVRVVECGTNFLCDAQRVVDGQLLLAVQPVAQRSTRHERGDVIQGAARLARVYQRNDVRMRQPRGDADLAQEPLLADRGAEFLLQNLDRDLAPVLPLLGEMHGGHATVAEQSLYRVTVSEGCLESERRFAQITRLDLWSLRHFTDKLPKCARARTGLTGRRNGVASGTSPPEENGRRGATSVLEELYSALVFLSRRQTPEGAEVFPLAGLPVLLARIQAVLP